METTSKHHEPVPAPRSRLAKIAVALAVLLVLAHVCSVVVPAGCRGVVFNRFRGGVQEPALGEGWHFLNPITCQVTLLSVRTNTYTMSHSMQEGQVEGRDGIDSKTQDGQQVTVDVSLRYHVDPQQVVALYRGIGIDYVSKVVLPTLRSSVRNVFAEYPVAAVYSQRRAEVSKRIQDMIVGALTPRGLVVDEFLLRNIEFSPEYAAAIESKQIEQQNGQRMRYEVEVATNEAERRRIQAEGEAKANDIRGAALRVNPAVVRYNYVRKVAPNVKALLIDKEDLATGGPSTPGQP